MDQSINRELFDFIARSPSPFHAVQETAKLLTEAGFKMLNEARPWHIEEGQGYFVTRNRSSIIAFRGPIKSFSGFMIAAAHCDSPCPRLKDAATTESGGYVKLNTECYGGMIYPSWMDRPLSAAGRVVYRTESGIATGLVDSREPVAVIPNVAIHMNRKVNSGYDYNAATDMLPLYGMADGGDLWDSFALPSGVSREDILSADLYLYDPAPGQRFHGLICAPRLDDLQSAFGALTGFLEAREADNMPVYCLFDNEEVGSSTKQGAASPFLTNVLTRVCHAIGLPQDGLDRKLAGSMMLSCDNAHALHPNHPELADKNQAPLPNGGVVIKYNTNQKYTSDAVSAALFKRMCQKARVPVQSFANRADLPGGSTLGNISNTKLALNTVDIGLAQLAMHACRETAGEADTLYLAKAAKQFYETVLKQSYDGNIEMLFREETV